MNERISVATIDNPEFINLQPLDVNPLMSACDIKVLYIGQNRNNSYIDKATATQMSKTLRGCPIVGWYIKEKEDFGDHGDQLIIDGEGVQFNKLTRPYGFIPTDAKVWFQFFEDTDEFGNKCLREYLMVQGYLWTGQFPEAQVALDNKDPQSMELDENSLKGHWATDNNTGLEFFIINDAIFSTLCILGEDVEPCFEGAQVLEPEISSTFSKQIVENKEFIKELFTMMQEVKYALNKNEGGLSMEDNKTTVEEPVVEQKNESTEATEQIIENSLNEQGENSELNTVENENNTEEFTKKSDDEEDEKEAPASEENNDESNNEEEDEDKKKPTKNTLEEESIELNTLQKDFNELQEKFALLEKENAELLAFKANIEDKQKDELINSFYMLSDEDKKEVIENKAKYSLDDIEKELSVICVRKKVNFNEEDNEDTMIPTTFNLDSHESDNIPAWIKAVDEVKNSNN